MKLVSSDFPTLSLKNPLMNQERIMSLDSKQSEQYNKVKKEAERDRAFMKELRGTYGLSENSYDEEEYEERIAEGADEPPVVICQFGQWVITEVGLEAAEYGNYFIARDRVDEKDWVAHLSEKDWIEMEDFCRALYHAQNIYRYLDLKSD